MAGITSDELASVRERQGMLQGMRLGIAIVIALSPIVSPTVITNRASQLAIPTAVFAIMVFIAEVMRRLRTKGSLSMARTMTIFDVVYVAIILTQTGGSLSPLQFVAFLHLIAVTLLLSYRSGLKVALAYSIAMFSIHTIRVAGLIPAILGSPNTVDASAKMEVFHAVAFWIVAIGTAVFSSLSERELRRRKGEFALIYELAQALEASRELEEVERALLERASSVFGFKRGIIVTPLGPESFAVITRTEREDRTGIVEDAAITKAWKAHAPQLFKAADRRENPLIAEVLDDAINIAVIPLTAEKEPVGALVLEWGERRGPKILGHTIRMLNQMGVQTALAIRNVMLMAEIQRLATTDGLTGLANRRVFDETLAREVAGADRTGQPLSLVMLDIDHFKAVNDTEGHQTGDEVLRSVAAALLSTCRQADLAARYGGEEMAIIMVNCDATQALEAAERFRRTVQACNSPIKVTVSAGTSTFPLHAFNADTLVAAADEALYYSKEHGRNRSTQSEREGLEAVHQLRLN